MSPGDERYLHILFLIVTVGRGIYGLFELMLGLALFAMAPVAQLAHLLVQGELREDPNDLVARYIDTAADVFLSGGFSFVVLYLISYGAVKIFLSIGLLRNKTWAYPVAIVLFSVFLAYQLYRITQTHSLTLTMVTATDLLAILLIIHEYYHAHKANSPQVDTRMGS